jgi:hypothetical protein
MQWTEYQNAASHTGIHIGLGVGPYAAEVVEQRDDWTWSLREIGAAGAGIVAEGRAVTSGAARVAAEGMAVALHGRAAMVERARSVEV